MITKNLKTSGFLLIASGLFFVLAAILSEQKSFFGIAGMFVLMGIGFIVKKPSPSSSL